MAGTTNWSGGYVDRTIPWPTTPDVRIYDLALRLEPGIPRHPHHPPFAYALAHKHGDSDYVGGYSSAMEVFSMGAHVGSHVDALGHIALNGEGYGGVVMQEHQTVTGGLDLNNAEDVPPLIGPGHLLDAERLFGRQLTPADGIGAAELQAWFADKPQPGPGSIVLVRTGWMTQHWPNSERYIGLKSGLPGVMRSGAEWLSERGILAAGSDTMNFEHKPDPAVVALSVHAHFLVEKGIYILECLSLDVLAAAGVTEFTFMALPLRLAGGTGSPLRPVAIVPQS